MKKYALLLLAVLLPFLSLAENRSREHALKIAEDFLGGARTKSAGLDLKMVWDGSDAVTKAAGAPAFYIFDNASGPGFVIVSGEDKVSPILGYSYENEFDPADMPPHFVQWMEEIERQVEYIRSTSSYPTRAGSDSDVGNVVIKHETALWNQGAPFNDLCPYDGANRSVTGCVATALAIVMKFHEWPDAGVGTIPAYTTSTKKIEVEAISLGHKYDWDNMLMSYNQGSNAVQNKAVARLMADCGAALEMDYTSSASGTLNHYIPAALSKYMKYDKSIMILDRGAYTADEWHDILHREITDNGPVIYSGYSSEAGHAFVLDGYTDENYYSLNWGWGGAYNGYFLLDALNPEGQGIGGSEGGYNLGQTAIVNVGKDHGGIPEEMFLMSASLTADREEFAVGVPFAVNTGVIYNASSRAYTGKIGFAVADIAGNVVEEIFSFDVVNLDSGYGYQFENEELVVNTSLEIGDRLIAVFWNNQRKRWEKVRGNSEYGVVDYIPLVDEFSIEQSLGFSFNTITREITMKVKNGVQVVLYGPSGETVSSWLSVTREPIVINTSEIPAGRYKLTFAKGDEYVELYFVAGPEEGSHE